MTTSEKKALQRDLKDPLHFFTLVAENNPEGLSNQFQAWGITYAGSDKQQMIAELMRMWQSGLEGKKKAMKLVSGVQYKQGVFPPDFDVVITGQAPPPAMLTTDGQGQETNWYSEVDWGQIGRGVSDVIGAIGDAVSGGGPVQGGGPTPPPAAAPAQQSGFNMQWIAVGAAALILVIALVIAMRK